MKRKSRKSDPQIVSALDTVVSLGDEKGTTVVAIGASAGGIEALTELLNHLPAHTGMAFVSPA